MHELYISLGDIIFQKTLRSKLWLLLKYRYPHEPLAEALKKHLGDFKMGDFWIANPPIDVVIPCFDLVENRSRFIKPWKPEYAHWPIVKAVLASSSANYSVPASTIAAGGGVSSAASWRVRGMIAGGLTGESVSAHYAVRSGPWAVLDASGATRTDDPRVGAYLPLVRRGT